MQPSMAVFSVLSMTKAAPHPNAAKLFFDFLVGSEGQKLYRDADYMPVDPAVPPKDPSLRPATTSSRQYISRLKQVDDGLPQWTKIYHEPFSLRRYPGLCASDAWTSREIRYVGPADRQPISPCGESRRMA